MSQHCPVEPIFRRQYGPLVASLTRRVGPHQLPLVEDAVQFAMMQALTFWVRTSIPSNPSAWLYTVAYRKLLTELRNDHHRQQLLYSQAEANPTFTEPAEIPLPNEMSDDMLRLLFITCSNTLAIESQLVFTLKSLCGLSTREIAQRLYISEANTHKRYGRARQHLAQQPNLLDELAHNELMQRLPAVLNVLYLMFTEGYLSSHNELAIRKDLCQEAIRLTTLLSEHLCQPETLALLALMHLHASRIHERQNELGHLRLMETQDRRQWDQHHIETGLQYLEKSASGDTLSRYHVEASIAAEHALAPDFASTRWDRIVKAYELLEQISPSPMITLNKALATAEWKGPGAGLMELNALNIPGWLERSYHWYAVKADLLIRSGDLSTAKPAVDRAIELAPSPMIKQALQARFKLT